VNQTARNRLTQINAGARQPRYAAANDGGSPVRPEDHRGDQELVSLALETRRAAAPIAAAVIHDRLIEIADELLDLASREENSGYESRGYGWPA
jgi:hypothetical protein